MYGRASEPANAGGNIRSGQVGNIKIKMWYWMGSRGQAGEKVKLVTSMGIISGRCFLLEPGKQ